MRKAIVEPVFGQIKERRGFRRFSFRGVGKVSREWKLDLLDGKHSEAIPFGLDAANGVRELETSAGGRSGADFEASENGNRGGERGKWSFVITGYRYRLARATIEKWRPNNYRVRGGGAGPIRDKSGREGLFPTDSWASRTPHTRRTHSWDLIGC